MSTISTQPAAGGSGAHKPAKPKSKKDKSQKKAAQPAGAESANGGFSLLGADKDAELDDVFGKSSAFAASAPPKPAAMPKPVPASPVEGVATAAAGPSTNKKRSADAIGPKTIKKAKAAPGAAKTGSESEVSATLPAASGTSKASVKEAGGEEEDVDEDSSDEDDGDISKLVHETVAGTAKKPKVKAVKYVPADETPTDKARRSLFIGNLPVECVNSKKGDRQLIAHLLTFAPTAKVESVRFRSIAFKNPTSGVPGEEGESKIKKRESERASAWKAEQAKLKAGGKEAEEADAAKTFLDAKGKRKVAFIKKNFHDEAAVCNAYVVFAHPHPDRSANVAPIMNPYEAATKVLEANGSRFMERHIRVDTLRDPSKTALASATTALGRRDAWLPQGTDPKKSVFVGGLDYAAKEEDVRAFFETLLVAERGPAEDEWVKEVRIVRDKDTQLGKGFGYVHFGDRQSVDEVLAIEASKLKFAKKTIRVQPAKTLPSPNTRAATETQEKTPYKGKVRNVPATVSKGDPALGDKLKDLSKEDRKLAKATDAERQARRLAKKQKRVAMQREEKGAVKLGPTKSGHKVDKAKKSRVRSSHALSKMKGSRQ